MITIWGSLKKFLLALHKIVVRSARIEREILQIQEDINSLEEAIARLEGEMEELERFLHSHVGERV